ncbi:alpha/beta fold hydrolase [Chelativorans sp. ZYF759]|nr:alpha/beta fold hydrolase [Chelativorans sp. ZYF759]
MAAAKTPPPHPELPDVPPIVSAHFTTPEGLRLATDIAGDPWRPRVIFVHGGGQSRRSWRSALQRMAAAGFSVVSLDLRGHGESDWAEDGDYSLEAHTRDLTAIVRAMPSRPSIVGASLGGRVALQTAAALGAESIRSLVLVDSTPRMNAAGLERVSNFLRASMVGFDSIEEATRTLETYAEREIGHNYFRLSHSIRTGADGRIYWRWDPKAALDRYLSPDAIEERLSAAAASLTMPTLLVRGTLSDLVTDDCVADFRHTLPTTEVFDIVGGGHLMKTQRLEVFCDATIDFLKRHEEAA